ncbi:MAG: major facilitator superfamily 1 [Pseudonocardiales bacterium]|nr:major facilitator superfamily 1 [Jatrophihabitantaceae bacterium]MCW2602058.1 major facilitator superfamily 1 [Pseudonocardiales bacterium]
MTSTAAGAAGPTKLDEPSGPDRPASAREDGEYDLRYAWRALSVVCMASTLMSLNGSTLNIALPTVVRHFNASSSAASWIIISFSLASTCVTLACGRLADVVARRTMYLVGLIVCTVASLLLGFSPNVQTLIGLQVVQAVAEAALLANSAVIVSHVFPPAMLGRALGIYMAGFSVASLLGPTIGGALATTLGWRWVFWFNVPLGVVCVVWGIVTLRPMPAGRKYAGFDLRGNILLVLGLGGFIVALSSVSTAGWGSPLVRIGIVLAAVFLPLFFWTQARTANPLLDVRVFKDKMFTLALSAGLVSSIATSAVVVLIALYLQAAKGYTPFAAGLHLLPLAGTKVVTSLSVGVLTSRMTNRASAVIGSATLSLGLLTLMTAVRLGGPAVLITVGLMVMGAGSGIFQPSNAAAMLEGVSSDRLGRVNAIRLTLQGCAGVIGTSLALALLTAPLSSQLQHAVFNGRAHELGAAAIDQLSSGFALALTVMTVASWAAVTMSNISRRAQRDEMRAHSAWSAAASRQHI